MEVEGLEMEGGRIKSYSNIPIDDMRRPSNQMPIVTWVGDQSPFMSPRCQLKYDELTCRPIATGRSLHLGGEYNEYLVDHLRWAGLESLFNLEDKVYTMLVRLFYANMGNAIVNGSEQFASSVKTKMIAINEGYVSAALQIPNSGESLFFVKKADVHKYLAEVGVSTEDYYGTFCTDPNPRRQLTGGIIKPEYRLLKHYLAINIWPRAGNGEEVHPFLGFMIYRFVIRRPLNIPHIICQVMLRTSDKAKMPKCIPYGAFLTRIFKYWDVPMFPGTDSIMTIERALDAVAARAIKGFSPGDGGAESSTRRRHSVSAPLVHISRTLL